MKLSSLKASRHCALLVALATTTALSAAPLTPSGPGLACSAAESNPAISVCQSGNLVCAGGRKYCCSGSVCKDAGTAGHSTLPLPPLPPTPLPPVLGPRGVASGIYAPPTKLK
ncbi:MAG: hypothetical protein EAZ30_09760 [Betaproteobacteria bacterium]|nr:MAG: hypothetical protein EAZ30_09760 [Betaproteobacteria bacterium]